MAFLLGRLASRIAARRGITATVPVYQDCEANIRLGRCSEPQIDWSAVATAARRIGYGYRPRAGFRRVGYYGSVYYGGWPAVAPRWRRRW